MESKILELKELRNNTHLQCVPISLYVVLRNQFLEEKRTNLSKITYKRLKSWVNYGEKFHKNLVKTLSGKEKKYFTEMFHGNFNVETFHQELNQNIRKYNLKLNMQTGITSRDIKELINKGMYPMILVNPEYINDETLEVTNKFKKKIRGTSKDLHHFIVVHGYDEKHMCIYDCDLQHEAGEVLSKHNLRCKVPFATLNRFLVKNSLYWYELIDKSNKTSLPQY